MTQEPRTARRIARNWPWISGLVAIALALALGLLLAARRWNLDLDTEWMSEIVEHRSPWWEVPARLFDFVGGGWMAVVVVPLTVVAVLAVRRRGWAVVFYVAATVLSVTVTQLLKGLFGRARPEEILVVSDYGSFPSGHVANAATLAVTLGLIVPRAWVWAVGTAYTAAMMLSRTYLGAHWLTDTLGGLVLGAGVAVMVWAPLARRLQREAARPPGAGPRSGPGALAPDRARPRPPGPRE